MSLLGQVAVIEVLRPTHSVLAIRTLTGQSEWVGHFARFKLWDRKRKLEAFNEGGNYGEFEPLNQYYFEDSYVLELKVEEHSSSLIVEAVLSSTHPCSGPPNPGEHYRYELIALNFNGAASVSFRPSGRAPSVDLDGTTVLGNIDSIVVGQNGRFTLDGEWGNLQLWGASVSVQVLKPWSD